MNFSLLHPSSPDYTAAARKPQWAALTGGLCAIVSIFALCGCGATVTVARLSPVDAAKERMKSTEWQQNVAEAKAKLEVEKLQETWKRDPQEVIRRMRAWIAEGKAKPEHMVVLCLEAARLRESTDPQAAAGAYLNAAELVQREVKKLPVPAAQWPQHPEAMRLLSLYNWAVSRFVTLEFSQLSSHGAVEIKGLDGAAFRVSATDDRIFGVLPIYYFDRLTPSDELKITGFQHTHRTDAVGAPFVGLRENTPERAWEMAYHNVRGSTTPVTALLSFGPASSSPKTVKLALVDASMRDQINIDGSRIPVSIDRSAPLAMGFEGMSHSALGLGGLLRGEDRLEKAGLYMVGAYDPNRIPVLMIHGLMSSPLMWRDMIDQLQADPAIAAHYQFWVFYYPSGQPIPLSAKILRENIEGARRHFDPKGHALASQNMVVVGHSMGGILSRSLITDIGDRGWKAISDQDFEKLDLPPDKKAEFRNVVFFKPMPQVKRAIFICAPLRGAHMSGGWMGRIGHALVKLPGKAVELQLHVLQGNADLLHEDFKTRGVASSILSLSPDAPVIKALNDSPFVPGVKYHSIIGDRGKGDSPHSSDGVVEYWSSHLDGAESELVVPADHGAYTHPMTVQEVRRILLEHCGIKTPHH